MGDVRIGHDRDTKEPVVLQYSERPLGGTIVGRTGFGKTTLLEHLILEDVRSGTSCIVIDAHGDLTNAVIEHAPAAARERMALIEVWEDRPFRLNLFAQPERPTANTPTIVA